MTNQDQYLVKLKGMGWSNEKIAAKLSTTPEEVEKQWQAIIRMGNNLMASGYVDLQAQFNVLAHQYQLVGESLKAVCGGLGDVYHPSQLKKVIDSLPPGKDLAEHLLENCIILHRYIPVSPEKALSDSLAAPHN